MLDAAGAESVIASVRQMNPERPLPPVSFRIGALLVSSTICVAVALVWLAIKWGKEGAWPGLILVIPVVAGYFYTYRRRCPECGGRLVFRNEFVTTTRVRCLYDCPRCNIAWTGVEGETADAS
jgi:hypothetical protein